MNPPEPDPEPDPPQVDYPQKSDRDKVEKEAVAYVTAPPTPYIAYLRKVRAHVLHALPPPPKSPLNSPPRGSARQKAWHRCLWPTVAAYVTLWQALCGSERAGTPRSG